MKTPLSLVIAGVIAAGMIPAAFALTTSGSSSSQGTAYTSPYGTFYQNGSTASMNSSSYSYSPYNYNYQYGSSSSYSLMPLYQYGSSSSYSSYYNPSLNTPGFQGLSCLGMTGQNFLSCLQQYGVMSTPGSLLIQNGGGSGLPTLTCNQYTGAQLQQCQQQLIDFWRSYDASLQIWWTQLQQYINGLMAQANINPTQVGSMSGSSLSSSSMPAQNEAALKEYWRVCGQYGFPEQQRCMHDALTDQLRYQDWITNLNRVQTTPNTFGSSSSRGTNSPYLPAGSYPTGNRGSGIYNGANMNANTSNNSNGSLNVNSNANSTTYGGATSSY